MDEHYALRVHCVIQYLTNPMVGVPGFQDLTNWLELDFPYRTFGTQEIHLPLANWILEQELLHNGPWDGQFAYVAQSRIRFLCCFIPLQIQIEAFEKGIMQKISGSRG